MPDSSDALDHPTQVALFRATIIGALAARDLHHGELAAELQALSQQRFFPPGSVRSRTYAVSTLERWLYRYRSAGLEGLAPKQRSDAGRGRTLDNAQRQLLIDIRREYPGASATLIVQTLETAGVLPEGAVSDQVVRRLYRQAGLPRRSARQSDGAPDEERQRLRWQAPAICSLWHADVCHALKIPSASGETTPALVHLLLDDHSRFIVRVEVRTTEREQDMLEIFAHAIREHGVAPDRLYTDGGATYSGSRLPLVCARLGTALVHPRPRDPQARGKGERIFRTLREQCTDLIRGARTTHDVFVRVLAWRERYHHTPHASLIGRTPAQVWKHGLASEAHQQRKLIDEDQLAAAYRFRERRRVRKDSTLSVDGQTYEVEAGWLAGKHVVLERSALRPDEAWVHFEDHRIALHPVDPERNARRRRKPRAPKAPVLPAGPVPNPADLMLDALVPPAGRDEEA